MQKFCAVFFALLLSGGAYAADADVTAERQGTVWLTGPSQRSSTGTVINSTDVLTDHHCYENGIEAHEEYPTDVAHRFVKIVKDDPANDLMILRFTGSFAAPVPFLSADDHPQKGDRIRIIGCPTKECNVLSEGSILVVNDDSYHGMIISASGWPGISGGGIYWWSPRAERWVEISLLQELGPYPVFASSGPATQIYVLQKVPGGFSVGVSPDDLLAFLKN